MKKRVLFSVINDYNGDQRIQRIAGALLAQGYDVEILARELPDSLPLSSFPYPVSRMKLPFHRGKLFYIAFTLRLFYALVKSRADLYVANDLDTLLPNYLVAKWRKKPLVYDSHEYYTECPEIIRRPLIQKMWLTLEGWLFPKLKFVYTVNSSIAHIYQQRYSVPVHTIRNLPLRKESPDYALSQRFQEKILLYQGALNEGRGIEKMIAAMAFLPEYQLWIIGKGDIEAALKTQASRYPHVRFLGFKKPEALHLLTPKALLGFSLEEDLGGNYHYCSPNKLVDYIQAHVPTICADLPEMAALTQHYKTGVVLPFSQQSPEFLAHHVRHICESPSHYSELVANCQLAAQELCWENEQAKLLSFYAEILSPENPICP